MRGLARLLAPCLTAVLAASCGTPATEPTGHFGGESEADAFVTVDAGSPDMESPGTGADVRPAEDLPVLPEAPDGQATASERVDVPDTGEPPDGADGVAPDPQDTAGDESDTPTSPLDLGLPPPGPLACETSPSRRLYGDQVGSNTTALYHFGSQAQSATPFGPTLGGVVNAPVTLPGAPGSIEVLVTRYDGVSCWLLALDAAGAELAATSWAAEWCAPPVITLAGAAVPFNSATGGAVAWFGSDKALDAPVVVTVGPRVTGAASNFGDSVFLGVQGNVLQVAPAGILAQVGTGLAVVTRVIVAGASRLPVVGWSGEPGAGLGDTLVFVSHSAVDGALKASDPVTLTGPVTTEPIALADCTDPLANGSSHWWCPSGLLVTGGDGWLAAHELTSGTPLAELPVQGAVTGLAASDDGHVYNGASHWLGGWELRVNDFSVAGVPASELVDSAPTPDACVASPMIDESGQLAFLVAGEVHRVSRSGGELAPGWSRAGGSAEGNAAPRFRDEACPGGGARLFVRERPSPAEHDSVSRVAARKQGGLYVTVDASPDGVTPNPQVVAVTEQGEIAWKADPMEGFGLKAPLAGLAAGNGVVAAAAQTDSDKVMAFAVNAADGTAKYAFTFPAWDVGGGVLEPRKLRALVHTGNDRFLVVGQYQTQPWIAWMAWVSAAGPTPAVLFDLQYDTPAVTRLYGATATATQWFVYGNWVDTLNNTAPGILFEFTSDGVSGPTPVRNYGGTDGPVVILGLEPTPTGFAQHQLRQPPSGPAGGYSTVVHLDATLDAVLGEVSFARPAVGLAVDAGGRAHVLLNDGSHAVLDGPGAADMTNDPLGNVDAFGFALSSERPFVVAARNDTQKPLDLLFRAQDRYGNAGCSAAGRCAATDCDDENPCTTNGCDPVTGLCVHASRPDATPCGPGLSCIAGTCQ